MAPQAPFSATEFIGKPWTDELAELAKHTFGEQLQVSQAGSGRAAIFVPGLWTIKLDAHNRVVDIRYG